MTQIYEEFSEGQVRILDKYVTNTSGNVFVLRNLPEVIKGALFSRYSRSNLGLRSLLLKEFILNEDTAFTSIAGLGIKECDEDQLAAIKKAQSFYDRILDGYGDDSIGELGGAHLAIENISLIAAKNIEDCRIGGSPLEKSTRYIYFDQKVNGEYMFYREPILMTSAYKSLYIETCNLLFETYSKLIPPLTALIEQKFPKEHQISKQAYTAALRAKVLDCLRSLLPASALTNIGLFGNGRFYEHLVQKALSHNLAELQEIGKDSLNELSKVIPSFVRRANTENKYYQSFLQFSEQMKDDLQIISKTVPLDPNETTPLVRLVSFDNDAVYKVAAALLFENSFHSLSALEEYCRSLSQEELLRILDAASFSRQSRRHKSPRALERASFTFEFVADFGVYRDLQRHRLVSQERQLLTCNYGYFVPPEILNTPMEKEYVETMEKAKKAYDIIAKELPEEAQYIVPQGYKIRWYFHVNLRELQWICELRSSPAGHASYRHVAQEMAKQIFASTPQFERFFKFIDFEGYELGRMGQEIRKQEKLELGNVNA